MLDDGITWITRGGKHIPIGATNDYMNKFIRNKGKKQKDNSKEIEELQKEYDSIKNMFDPRKAELKDKINALKENKDLETYKKEQKIKTTASKEKNEAEKKQRLSISKQQSENKNEQEYMMSHRPLKTGVTADNLINQKADMPMPKDVYEHPEYYSLIGDKYTKETMEQLNKVRGNSNGVITIYRATTGDKINDGDWVTLSKSYAENHNYSQLDNKGKVIEMKVRADDIQFAGDDLAEWGYFPKRRKGNK